MSGREQNMAPDDEVLIQSYYACDEAAFEKLFSRYWKRLWAFFRLLGFGEDDAEDLAQESLIRVCLTKGKPRAQFRPGAGVFSVWLYRIAYRVACDEWRRRRREPVMVSLEELAVDGTAPWEPADRGPDAEQQAAANELLDALAECLEELSPAERAAVVLVCILGFRGAAAGRVVGTTGDAVHTALHRAREKLSESMNSKGYESRDDADPRALRPAMAERDEEFLVQLEEHIVVRCRGRQPAGVRPRKRRRGGIRRKRRQRGGIRRKRRQRGGAKHE